MMEDLKNLPLGHPDVYRNRTLNWNPRFVTPLPCNKTFPLILPSQFDVGLPQPEVSLWASGQFLSGSPPVAAGTAGVRLPGRGGVEEPPRPGGPPHSRLTGGDVGGAECSPRQSAD